MPEIYDESELLMQFCIKNKFSLGKTHSDVPNVIKDQRIGDQSVSIVVKAINENQLEDNLQGISALISFNQLNPIPRIQNHQALNLGSDINIFENAALIVENLHQATINAIKNSKPLKNPNLSVEKVKEMTEKMFRGKLFAVRVPE